MAHWKVVLEYDGTNFSGWQIQPNGRTVQEELERALRQISGSPVRVAGGGRTDAGVHARGQVATFTLEKDVAPEDLRRSLNGVLPEDVVVHSTAIVDSLFHARYSAVAREYEYTIAIGPAAIHRRTMWVCPYRLDAEVLQRSAARVIGEFDFTSFAKVGSEMEHGRCVVSRSEWIMHDRRWAYHVRSNRFLYGMVRALVGTMVDMARGYRPESDWDAILAAKDRRQAGTAAPACGLCLVAIEY
jgi:tRNA pseudouridine38-40 synthase